MRRLLRDFAEVQYGKSPHGVFCKDGQIPVVGTGGIYGFADRFLFLGPAVIVPRKGSLGNPQYMNEPFWPVDTTYAVLPKTGVDPRWLYYCLARFDLAKLNEATGVPSINRDWLYKIPLVDIDYATQKSIADILATVDEFIEQTEILITKAQQVKAGLMHEIFTRGITSDGNLRPLYEQAPQLYKKSQIGWIPKDWDIQSCAEICLAVIDCKNRTPPATEEGHAVIRTPNVRDGEFIWSDLLRTDSQSYLEWTARGRPVPGDIVITREAPVGEVCMIPPELEGACLGQRIMLYRPDPDEVLGDFLVQVLQSPRVRKYLDIISGGSTVGHVRVGDIRNLHVPCAPLEEQGRISDVMSRVKRQLADLREECSKWHQIKSGLMQDLLTGKVSVPATTPTNSAKDSL